MVQVIIIAVVVVIGLIVLATVIGLIIKAVNDAAKREQEEKIAQQEKEDSIASALVIKAAEAEKSGNEEPMTDENGALLTPVERWQYIHTEKGGNCLEAEGMTGGHVLSKKCANNNNQKWIYSPELKRIKNRTNFCLSTGGDYHSMQECNLTDDNQKFVYDVNTNRIKSTTTGECIASKPDNWVWDWGCDGNNDDQHFRFDTTF